MSPLTEKLVTLLRGFAVYFASPYTLVTLLLFIAYTWTILHCADVGIEESERLSWSTGVDAFVGKLWLRSGRVVDWWEVRATSSPVAPLHVFGRAAVKHDGDGNPNPQSAEWTPGRRPTVSLLFVSVPAVLWDRPLRETREMEGRDGVGGASEEPRQASSQAPVPADGPAQELLRSFQRGFGCAVDYTIVTVADATTSLVEQCSLCNTLSTAQAARKRGQRQGGQLPPVKLLPHRQLSDGGDADSTGRFICLPRACTAAAAVNTNSSACVTYKDVASVAPLRQENVLVNDDEGEVVLIRVTHSTLPRLMDEAGKEGGAPTGGRGQSVGTLVVVVDVAAPLRCAASNVDAWKGLSELLQGLVPSHKFAQGNATEYPAVQHLVRGIVAAFHPRWLLFVSHCGLRNSPEESAAAAMSSRVRVLNTTSMNLAGLQQPTLRWATFPAPESGATAMMELVPAARHMYFV